MTSRPDDGLRPIFKSNLERMRFHCQSVETGGTGSGVPDTNYCRDGVEGWIEYKATSGWTVDLRPEQIGWVERRVRCGGRVWIAVRRRHDGGPRRGPPCDELYMFPGALVRPARLEGLRSTRLAADLFGPLDGGPSRWDWDAVAALLTRRSP